MFSKYVEDYCIRYAYPAEAVKALAEAAAAVEIDPEMKAAFEESYAAYKAAPTGETVTNAYRLIKEKAPGLSIPTEATELLLFILFSEHLETMYREKPLPERYFCGVMTDLRSKLMECYTVKGIWGSFVADWFIPFFHLERFAIGRLQYNFVTMPQCETLDGKYTFQGGEKALTIHIPSTGPLLAEDIEASLQEAADFYAEEFEGDCVLFTCGTWILFSGHEEMLPETSNVRLFRQHFHMMADEIDAQGGDLWRIFGTQDTKNVAALPRDTGLRRAYAAWLEAGKPVGRARGVRYVKKANR